MKRLLIIALLLLVCAPTGFARRKKVKAGTIDNHVYTDRDHGFNIPLPEGWKTKVGDQKSHFRLILVQKNFEVPPDYLEAEDYTQVPRIVIWIDTSSLGASAFLDSLVSPDFKSKQKKELYREFDLLNEASTSSGTYRDPLVRKSRKSLRVDGSKGLRWSGYAKYYKEVSLSASSTGGGKRVRGAYGGTVITLKKDDTIIAFHMMCEWPYYPSIDLVLMQIVKGLKWTDAEEEGKG